MIYKILQDERDFNPVNLENLVILPKCSMGLLFYGIAGVYPCPGAAGHVEEV